MEQEIVRVHGRAARALANQSLPFSVCSVLREEDIYNSFDAEQVRKAALKDVVSMVSMFSQHFTRHIRSIYIESFLNPHTSHPVSPQLIRHIPFLFCHLHDSGAVYIFQEKDKNIRSRYNGRQFLSWLQDVDDKYEKIKVHHQTFSLFLYFESSFFLSKPENDMGAVVIKPSSGRLGCQRPCIFSCCWIKRGDI